MPPYDEDDDVEAILPGTISQDVTPSYTPDQIESIGSLIEAQDQIMAQHSQYAQSLQQTQAQADARGADLDVSEKMFRILDTQLPKPFRDFELRGLARHLGVDPKSESLKELSKLVLGLDPDSSMAVKKAFTSKIGDATPGQISQMTRSLMTGELSPSVLATEVMKGGAATQPMETGSTGKIPAQDPDQLTQSAKAVADAQPTKTDNRTVDPAMAAALGYDANSSSSAEILKKHPAIGSMDGKEQKELAKDLQTNRHFTSVSVSLIDKIDKMITDDPLAVGVLLPFTSTPQNPAKYIVNINDGIGNYVKTLFPEGVDKFVRSLPGYDKKSEEEIRKTAATYMAVANSTYNLAYASAKAKDPSGRLSDQDIQIELRSLGLDAGSADLFKAGLANHKADLLNRYNNKVETSTGGPATNPMDKPRTLNNDPAPAAASSANPKEASVTPSKEATGQTPSEQSQIARAKEQQKESDEAAKRKFELEQAPRDALLRLQAAERDSMRLQLAMDQAKELKDWRQYQMLRDKQREAQRQADKISAAFSRFASQLSRIGSTSTPGGSSGGGEQDANAFKIGERPQRRAPTPAPAVSGFKKYKRE